METYTLEALEDLKDVLTDAGIRWADDPARLTPPGVLVQVTALDRHTLGALEVTTRLVLVVPSASPPRALASLVELLNQVCEVVEPDGPVTAATLPLPGDPAPLPALTFPLILS